MLRNIWNRELNLAKLQGFKNIHERRYVSSLFNFIIFQCVIFYDGDNAFESKMNNLLVKFNYIVTQFRQRCM